MISGMISGMIVGMVAGMVAASGYARRQESGWILSWNRPEIMKRFTETGSPGRNGLFFM